MDRVSKEFSLTGKDVQLASDLVGHKERFDPVNRKLGSIENVSTLKKRRSKSPYPWS